MSMPRRPPKRNGLTLPRQLQQELGLSLGSSEYGTKGGIHRGGANRRQDRREDKRKADRVEKKAGRVLGNARHWDKDEGTIADANDETEDEERTRAEEARPETVNQSRPKEPPQVVALTPNPTARKLKSILKHKAPSTRPLSPIEESDRERSRSPVLVLDKSSKSFKDRSAQDDAEIAALEKKLGLKTKRLPKSFDDDGLVDLLEGLDREDDDRKRKGEGQDWLERKRRRAAVCGHPEQDSESDVEAGNLLGEGLDAVCSDEEDFVGFGLADKDATAKPAVSKRENPYIAPPVSETSGNVKPAENYIPPSLRKPADSEAVSLQRLRRQLQGQLNKLSEANLLSILAEVEKFYQTNARQDVTSTLIDLLLSLLGDPSVLQKTFVILHASFAAAVYKVVGMDFGAEFVSQLVRRFESFHKPHEAAVGKQGVNLISLLAHLYTFHMIGSNLVFDHIRILLETLSETNAELLLRIVRDAGPQLRQDDPSSLKDIVLLMQKSAAGAQAEGAAVSVRTKFMMETIIDLKNNKLKSEIASVGVASEHITRMRKVLGTLNSRNVRASEPMRIGLSDVKNAERHGKWWLVGASWKEQEAATQLVPAIGVDQVNGRDEILDGAEADLLILARQHRMNTAVRRAIFIAIMSATDYQDAQRRLVKLRLKRSQVQEIPRVLMHCAAAETQYNPYYTLIAKTLCADKRTKMAFQFSLWDFFKRLGEEADDLGGEHSEDREEVELKEIANTARMFASLIADGTMSLSILKTLNLTILKEQARMFVEILLIVVITKSQERVEVRAEDEDEDEDEDVDVDVDEDGLAKIFARCQDTPQMIGGLRHFLKTVVRHTDLANSEAELRLVRWGCGLAIDTLKAVSSSTRVS